MNLQSIKNISIKKYLSSIGCELATDRGHYGMYYAPYRKDIQASLKVDFTKNIWIDFSTAQGGSILDLVMKLEQCDFRSAVQSLQNCQLEKGSFSFHCNKSISKQSTGIQINTIKKLENIALLEYLQSRAIIYKQLSNIVKNVIILLRIRTILQLHFQMTLEVMSCAASISKVVPTKASHGCKMALIHFWYSKALSIISHTRHIIKA